MSTTRRTEVTIHSLRGLNLTKFDRYKIIRKTGLSVDDLGPPTSPRLEGRPLKRNGFTPVPSSPSRSFPDFRLVAPPSPGRKRWWGGGWRGVEEGGLEGAQVLVKDFYSLKVKVFFLPSVSHRTNTFSCWSFCLLQLVYATRGRNYD